jgi:hypothetical protein
LFYPGAAAVLKAAVLKAAVVVAADADPTEEALEVEAVVEASVLPRAEVLRGIIADRRRAEVAREALAPRQGRGRHARKAVDSRRKALETARVVAGEGAAAAGKAAAGRVPADRVAEPIPRRLLPES